MAILSNYAYLMIGTTSDSTTTYEKLCDVTSIPDLGGAPESIDVTTLSDMVQRNINGIQSVDSYEFGAWYDLTTYTALKAIQDADTVRPFQVWFGTDGANGKFEWEGKLSVFVGGVESNVAVPMTITISDEGDDPLHLVS